jgi:hypothetical protein
MKTIRLDWSKTPAPAQPDELVLCTNPLAQKPFVWFEDYFDYPAHFKEIYCSAKTKSATWTEAPEFKAVKILDVPYLDAFEHHMHSFWMQVERDQKLIKNLIEKENPEIIVISGIKPDIDAIISCKFDPGLFEFTLRNLAEKQNIPVKVYKNKDFKSSVSQPKRSDQPGWFKKIAGAISAQIQAFKYRQDIDSTKKMVFVSSQVFARIGSILQLEAKTKQNIHIVSLDTACCKDVLSIYTLCGTQISVIARIKLYQKAMFVFGRIPKKIWSKVFTKNGINYNDIAEKALTHEIEEFLWQECYRLLLLKAAIEKICPMSLLVLYDHGVLEGCSVQLAKKFKVQTITLQHGIASREYPGYTPHTTDFFACWGKNEKTMLIKQGLKDEKIVVIGNPCFDLLWQKFVNVKREIPRINNTYKILVATQGVSSSVEWRFVITPTVRIIHEIIKLSLPSQYQIIFRLHPNDLLDSSVCQMAEQAGMRITKGLPLSKQLEECDVVVTMGSTVGFEALLAGKALVSMNWLGTDEFIPFALNGVAEKSHSPKDFVEAIEKSLLLQNTNQAAIKIFLRGYLYGPNSISRLMEFITV